MHDELIPLGWDDALEAAWALAAGPDGSAPAPARASRLDRGWSTLLLGPDGPQLRLRNIGADVAVGDWVVPSADGERVDLVLPRRSAFVRRASFEGARAESHTLAANIDVVFLLHALTSPPNPRRVERELVLAYDSGAMPVLLMTKADAVDDVRPTVAAVEDVALGVPVVPVSSRTGEGLETIRSYAGDHYTMALLGSSGVGKSTLVNALVGREAQRTADVREGDQRGRHTTVAPELVALPGGGWLIDTPGLRAVSLWSSGRGIERAFADVFDLMDSCRFRDCKHEDEPGCAVQEAIAAGTLDPIRLISLKRLVAEEARIEDEQREKVKADDRRGRPRPRPSADDDDLDDLDDDVDGLDDLDGDDVRSTPS
ncbi:MAG TPA: ribosome small subunit-dependent GTPase A [Ilumatobacteraceae bacterium]